MPELPQVVPGEPVQSTTFGNPVIARVVSRYADATARDFANPLPQPGDPAYLTSTEELQIYNGTDWETYAIDAEKVNIAGDTMTGVLVLVSGSKVEGVAAANWDISRTDVPQVWRQAIDAAGNLVLQGGANTGALATALSITEADLWLQAIRLILPEVGSLIDAQVVVGEGGLVGTGSIVGIVSPDFAGTRWVAQVKGGSFEIINAFAPSTQLLALTSATFLVPVVYDATTGAAPNVNVAAGGTMRRSTAAVALQADLDALQAQVTALQAIVDAL